jgi:nitrous oxidase accessory protein NosD
VIEQPTIIRNGNTLYVGGSGPNNYTKIQKAINHAVSGDTVYVFNGTYYENLIIEKKSINLVGEDRNITVIQGNNSMGAIFIEYLEVNISGFTIRSVMPGPQKFGIYVTSYFGGIGGHCGIFNNIFTNLNIGVVLYATWGYNNVYNNIFREIETGIIICDSVYDNIYQNEIYGCRTGIDIMSDRGGTYNIRVHHNIIRNNQEGVFLFEDDTIARNHQNRYFRDRGEIENTNIHSGEITFSIKNNYIHSNEILFNHIGLKIDSRGNKGVINNHIFGNNFISNLEYNAQVEKIGNNNIWDDRGFGNYWDDYRGKDSDGDGVGDTPYIIQLSLFSKNIDYYPMMEPYHDFNPDAPDAPSIDGPSQWDVDTTASFSFNTNDPNGDDVHYFINWGDGDFEGWIGPYSSGEDVIVSHQWTDQGVYIISAQAKDNKGLISPMGNKEIWIYGKIATFDSILFRFLEGFPLLMEVILRLIR